jgi:hypothetical protein
LIESFYIELLEIDELPKIPPGVLGNYEVALLYLQKFGTEKLPEEKFRELNLDAFGSWVKNTEKIRLPFNIPELVSRIPERILGSLCLTNSQILEIPNLVEVGGYLDLYNSQIKNLPNLKVVGEHLYLKNSKIQELPNLSVVGVCIWAKKEKLDYWKDYFRNIGRQHLVEKLSK